MIKLRYAFSSLLSITLISLSPFCFAQLVNVGDCRVIEERLARFGCYDDLEENKQTAPKASPLAEASSSVSSFGKVSETSRTRIIEGGDGKSELIDTVAALEKRLPNRWLITLRSGQRWQQLVSKRYIMKVGDEVRIYPSLWGNSYRLTSARLSSHIQVERVD